MRIALVLMIVVGWLGCGQDAAQPPPPQLPPPTAPVGVPPTAPVGVPPTAPVGVPPTAPVGVPPTGIAPGDPQVRVGGRAVWPPTGPGCAELVGCCSAGPSSDVMLFCQMSVATPPVNCGAALGSVRSYLGERGMAVPAACQPGAATGSAPAWVALALPQVAGWQRAPGEDQGPERGYVVEYNIHGAISVTVYVYRAGVAGIRRDPAMLGAQVQGALAGMRRAQQLGRYDAVRELGPVTNASIGSGPGAPLAAHQRVMITRGGVERLSETYVTTHRGFFFKLRISLFVDQSPRTDASLQSLLNQLAPAIHE